MLFGHVVLLVPLLLTRIVGLSIGNVIISNRLKNLYLMNLAKLC